MENGPSLVLVPINKLPSGLIPWLAEQLDELFGLDVSKGEMTSSPDESYNAERQQHYGGALMEKLSSLPISKQRVLGLIPYFCATAAQFYSITQGQAVSNRFQLPEQNLSKQISRSFENCF